VSGDTAHRFILAYDIAEDVRRTRVAHTLESYGDRIQYSVFIIDVRPARIVRLRASLRRHMDLAEDRALICDLGPISSSSRRLIEYIGHPPAITGQGPLIL
jgi:CRISPR-associated protein Cas2